MSASTRFATADCFTGQYKDRPSFISGILGRLKIAAKQDGWPGTVLFDADWLEETGKPPLAVIALQPGTGDVTVADVRLFLVEKRKKQFRLVGEAA